MAIATAVDGGVARDAGSHDGVARDAGSHDGVARDAGSHDGVARDAGSHDGVARDAGSHDGVARDAAGADAAVGGSPQPDASSVSYSNQTLNSLIALLSAKGVAISRGRDEVVLRFLDESETRFHAPERLDLVGVRELKRVVIRGQGKGRTILDFSAHLQLPGGAAFTVRDSSAELHVSDLTIRGAYSGWVDRQARVPRTDADGLRQDAGRWNKALLAQGEGTILVASGVEVRGFYYGLTAESLATMQGSDVRVLEAGDAGFFTYSGGKMFLAGAVAAYSADLPRRLGYGFVAETADHGRHYGDCGTDRGSESYHACLVVAAALIDDRERSTIEATEAVSHDNLSGGFMANLGGRMTVNGALAYNNQGRDAEGRPLTETQLSGDKPNVYPAGSYGHGIGFDARYGSRITVHDGNAFNNAIGFSAWRDSEMGANRAAAWNNRAYGFHAVHRGRIDARSSKTFGPYQEYGYAVDESSSMIRVDGRQFDDDLPPFCLRTPYQQCYQVTPEKQSHPTLNPVRSFSDGEAHLGLFELQ
ncbi:MAG: hypothetical protein IPL40_05765 [Proteobacteria bacterium]|nr:hypothetical protein [Pseudomonadota bacterium]